MRIYCVRDIKSESYGIPFFAENDRIACRSFCDLVADTSTVISRHPEDFTLVCIGDYDQFSSKILPCEPRFVSNAVDWLDFISSRDVRGDVTL